MKIQLSDGSAMVLIQLLRGLDELGGRPVLVGGLVPPMLQGVLDPEDFYLASEPRRTSDCDVAIDVAVAGAKRWREAEALLSQLGFQKEPRENQFRWGHTCGLKLDPLPVPAGIERGDPAAVAFARPFVPGDTSVFYRGYELALELFVEVVIELDDGSKHALRIAGVAALLSMKLQAWTDRRHLKKKDAQDVGWLLRHSDPWVIARHLRDARSRRPELVEEVISRLETHFSDPDHDGISDYARQAHGINDDFTQRHRDAVATAVVEVLKVYRGNSLV